MNDSSGGETPSKRSTHHRHLRQASWAIVIFAIVWFLPALILYILAAASCWGRPHGFGQCEIFTSLPWIGLALSWGAYLFVVWILHELGRETDSKPSGESPVFRSAWRYAKQGYIELEKGHHHFVRRVHRVASVAFAGLAAYVSFQIIEADTLVNLAVAAIAYTIGELLNWRTYTPPPEGLEGKVATSPVPPGSGPSERGADGGRPKVGVETDVKPDVEGFLRTHFGSEYTIEPESVVGSTLVDFRMAGKEGGASGVVIDVKKVHEPIDKQSLDAFLNTAQTIHNYAKGAKIVLDTLLLIIAKSKLPDPSLGTPPPEDEQGRHGKTRVVILTEDELKTLSHAAVQEKLGIGV